MTKLNCSKRGKEWRGKYLSQNEEFCYLKPKMTCN